MFTIDDSTRDLPAVHGDPPGGQALDPRWTPNLIIQMTLIEISQTVRLGIDLFFFFIFLGIHNLRRTVNMV